MENHLARQAKEIAEMSVLSRSLKEELETERTKRVALEQEMSVLSRSLKEELETERTKCVALEQEMSVLSRSLKEELETERTKRVALEQEMSTCAELEARVRNRDLRIAALERRLTAVEDSTSFQIGNALVSAAKAPRSAVRLPGRIWGIYRMRVDRNNAATKSLPAAAKRQEEYLLQLHHERGVAGIRQHLAAHYSADEVGLRNALISAGKMLRARGFSKDEITLLREAVALNRSDTSLRALYWAMQREGDLAAAWQAVRDLRDLYGERPSTLQQEVLNKLSRSAAFQLSVVDKIPPQPVAQLTSIPNRVCYVLHNSLPFASGGYATRAQGMALGLKGAGFDVVALTRPGFPLDAKPELVADEIPVQDDIEGVPYRRLLKPSRQGSSAVEYMEAAADAMAAEFERIRPAFVLAASNYQTALPALIAARRLGIPFAYEIRGFWEITRISREPEFIHTPSYKIQELLEAETAKHADHVFTLTGPMKQEMVRRGVAANQITLLPNSCQPERFVPRPRDEALAATLGVPSDVPVIGYIGTFVQYEGLELLVGAAAELRDRGLPFRLLLVGNENVSAGDAGPITTEIRRIAAERGLEDWLIMPGRVPHDQVEAYYSLIDIAPFPRKAQPVTEMVSPMKPLEAYAMEKAVVASSVGALQELVQDGKTGLIFEKDNVASLTDVLARLIADPDLRERLGKEGRRWVEAERTWDATTRIAAEKIRAIIAEKAPSVAAPIH
jgi:glycosyltransferase involved in cell wall biosynthesis